MVTVFELQASDDHAGRRLDALLWLTISISLALGLAGHLLGKEKEKKTHTNRHSYKHSITQNSQQIGHFTVLHLTTHLRREGQILIRQIEPSQC